MGETLPPRLPAGTPERVSPAWSSEDGRGRILVVDDEALTRQILADQLGAEGYLVRTARDGVEALALVAAEAPDLLLLDVVMPELDGFEVCRRLKADAGTILIPVVMVTALSAAADRLHGIEVGAEDFLSKPVNPEELRTRVRSLLRIKRHTDDLENAETVLSSLALTVEARDPHTNGHCDRLARYAVALGERLGLPVPHLRALRRGASLHDLGKIGIPDAILLKPGPLTEAERAIIQEHPAIGERICAPLKSLHLVCPIIRHHHERWDGSGYPDGLRGEAIPLTARILQVVDVYDALTSTRPYKPPYHREQACAILRAETAKGWWDPAIVEAFIALLGQAALGPEGDPHA